MFGRNGRLVLHDSATRPLPEVLNLALGHAVITASKSVAEQRVYAVYDDLYM